jgi:uncharacterized protein YgiM (DUF1202 family)
MKTVGGNRCLLIATVSLVMATLPLAGTAQEEVLNDGQAPPQRISQQRFVSDKLVLNVYAEPDQSSARVATIQTGDVVEELERSANLVRVRLEDGREGWVGASYLTSDAPAAARLRELQSQQKTAARGSDKAFAEEIARLKKENAALKTQVNELQASAMAPVAPVDERARLIATNASEVVSEPGEVAGTAPSRGAWSGWLIAVVLTGALGYAGGYQTLARRIRRKFGGLKIY